MYGWFRGGVRLGLRPLGRTYRPSSSVRWGGARFFENYLKKLFIFLMKKLMDSHLKGAVKVTNL